MPIYAYRCSTCGYAKDVLQKMSDPLLTACPECGAPTFQKQVTAAGFQLKGSGWYVTDFRGGDKPAADRGGDNGKPAANGEAAKPDSAAAPAPSAAKSESATSPAPATSPAAPPASSSGSK